MVLISDNYCTNGKQSYKCFQSTKIDSNCKIC